MEINSLDVYDLLAENYDGKMSSDVNNNRIREFVWSASKPYIARDHTVLDFGGGTGLDLSWLSSKAGTVMVCEPSVKMRTTAIEKTKTEQLNNVFFMESVDFRNWEMDKPFPSKIDFVLSNFAVLNSILYIEGLYRELWLHTSQNATLIFTVLDVFPRKYRFPSVIRRIADRLRFMLAKKSYVIKGQIHNTVVHTHFKIISASGPYFKCVKSVNIPGSMFRLYIFKRNNASLD
jgi:hypothetical protein